MKFVIGLIVGLIAAPLALLLAGIAGWLPSNATSEPPRWESSIGMRALDASLEKRSDRLTNPVKSNDAAAAAEGGRIYADNCAGCHGDARGPSALGSRGLYPRAPQFFQEGSDVSAPEAFAAIHDGVRYSGMGAWSNHLTDQQTWEVANFIAKLRSRGPMKDMD